MKKLLRAGGDCEGRFGPKALASHARSSTGSPRVRGALIAKKVTGLGVEIGKGDGWWFESSERRCCWLLAGWPVSRHREQISKKCPED